MNQQQQALRLWVWYCGDGTRWQLAKTSDGYWYCALGQGGKRIARWESGFPPGLGPLPEGFDAR